MRKLNTVKKGIIIGSFAILGITTVSAQRDNDQRKEQLTFAELLEKFDKDGDLKLSIEEVEGPLKENFISIDTNEDGYITEEEFNNAPKPERKEKKERN
ncbi:EF-hand domain-containing protein [Flavicella sp.]|uniref:EF-hand domain-containing protein n=1 Tax=Flavicella sp. TaxID=2957742 RepID=UPI003018C6E0